MVIGNYEALRVVTQSVLQVIVPDCLETTLNIKVWEKCKI